MFRAKKIINITIHLTKKLDKEENERNTIPCTWLDNMVEDSVGSESMHRGTNK